MLTDSYKGIVLSVDFLMLSMAPKPGQDSAQLDQIKPVGSPDKKSGALRRHDFKANKQVSFEEPCEFEDLSDKVWTRIGLLWGLNQVHSPSQQQLMNALVYKGQYTEEAENKISNRM